MKTDGWKTYIIALALVGFGIGGFFAGKMDLTQAMQIIGTGLGFAALRHGVSKAEVKK